MDLSSRKLELHKEFLKIQRVDVIVRLEKIIKKENKKSEPKSFKAMTIEEFNARINQSIEYFENDRLIEAQELKAKVEEWS